MEEILDAAEPACVAADPFNEAGRICVNSPFGIGPGAGLFQQPGRDRFVGRRVGSGKDDAFPCIRGPGTLRILGHDAGLGLCPLNVNGNSCGRGARITRAVGRKGPCAVFEIL